MFEIGFNTIQNVIELKPLYETTISKCSFNTIQNVIELKL